MLSTHTHRDTHNFQEGEGPLIRVEELALGPWSKDKLQIIMGAGKGMAIPVALPPMCPSLTDGHLASA